MKKQITNGLIFAFLMSMLIACNTKKTEPSAGMDKEQIKKEIQAKENEYAALYNAGELKNIGYYAEDATVFYQNRAPLVGKDTIVKFLKADLAGNTNRIAFTTNEVFVSNDGIMVVEIGHYEVFDSANIAINTGNYMVLFEKRNGNYYSVREMSASDMPIE